MACISCGSGLHWECSMQPCCCKNEAPVAKEDDEDDEEETRSIRGYKRDTTLKDQQSTGRKRAAVLYPINKNAPGPCEWQGLRFAGGGQFSIIGCTNGLQEARHHGPDKNTLNNEEGNVHRICHFCHNRWHTLNDAEYTPGDPGSTHNPVDKASLEELLDNALYWSNKKTVRVRD